MRTRNRRRTDDRWSALVEAVIIFPLVMLLTFGAIEFGIGFSQKGGLESISRAGARTGATLAADATVNPGDNEDASNSIGVETVRAINAALSSTAIPEMNRVVVYRIENLGGGVTNSHGPSGWGGSCRGADCIVYTFDNVGKQFNLSSGSGAWPVANRMACGNAPDRLGVQLEGKFNFLTNLIGTAPIKLTAKSVLQLEPTSDC